MTDRRGVLFLFFDLPMVTKEEKRTYNRFRKKMLALGFVPLQESVYIKLMHSMENAESAIADVEKIAPREGQVCVLKMTIRQFGNIVKFGDAGFDFHQLTDDMVFI